MGTVGEGVGSDVGENVGLLVGAGVGVLVGCAVGLGVGPPHRLHSGFLLLLPFVSCHKPVFCPDVTARFTLSATPASAADPSPGDQLRYADGDPSAHAHVAPETRSSPIQQFLSSAWHSAYAAA